MKEQDDKTLEKKVEPVTETDCVSVMNPEMVRNYEDDEPCNDGTTR
jgi:hypothetical protein